MLRTASFLFVCTVLSFTLSAQSLLRDIHPGGDGIPQHPLYAKLPNGLVVFKAKDAATGFEPWVSDGSPGGTRLLRDIRSGSYDSLWGPFSRYKNELFFAALDQAAGTELWKTDGTTSGTVLVSDTSPGTSSGLYYSAGREFGDLLWFGADDGVHGRELWTSDGSTAGTQLFADLRPGSRPSRPSPSLEFDGTLYFNASAPSAYSLWKTQGTTQSTSLVAEVTVDSRAVVLGGAFYFFHNDGTGFALWRSDGSPSGTAEVSPLQPGVVGAPPQPYVVSNRIVFEAWSPGGRELWVSDGTSAGTTYLDLEPGTSESSPNDFVVVDDEVYFTAATSSQGRELWRTDGTPGGTSIVLDYSPGPSSSFASSQSVARTGSHSSLLIATMDDGVHGLEPHVIDTATGTATLLADLEPGPGSSEPKDYFTAHGQVFFSARTTLLGRELYVVSVESLGAAHVESFGIGCPGSASMVPQLRAGTAPVPGNVLELQVTDVLPSTSVGIMFSASPSDLALGGGCSLLVGPHLTFSGTAVVEGKWALDLPIPNQAEFVGQTGFFQAVSLDPMGAFQNLAAFSPGLRVAMGH